VCSCKPQCPYAKRVHGNNHLALLYNYSKQEVTIKCFHPDCDKSIKEQQVEPVRFAFSPSSAEVCCASSLHDYAAKVSWSDDYAEDTMKPYPTDKGTVAAIVAGMGLGESSSTPLL
jgi:hypothetical protein